MFRNIGRWFRQSLRPLLAPITPRAPQRSCDLSLTFCHLRLNLTAPFQHPRKTTPFQTTLLPCGGSSDLNGRSSRCSVFGACYHYCWHYDRGSSYYERDGACRLHLLTPSDSTDNHYLKQLFTILHTAFHLTCPPLRYVSPLN
jgi:hypothetical protein